MTAALQLPVDVHVVVDFWISLWHQFFRQVFVVLGTRPGALLGVFVMSAVIHNLGIWGLGRGTEICTVGFFIPHRRWSDLGARV